MSLKMKRFQKGSAVYTCKDCGKKTRETGYGESDLRMCAACFVVSSAENTHSDQGHGGGLKDCKICAEGNGMELAEWTTYCEANERALQENIVYKMMAEMMAADPSVKNILRDRQ